MEEKANLKEYKLNDFYQAVVLKTTGYPLIRLEKGTGRYVFFVFADPANKAEETIKLYWDNQLLLLKHKQTRYRRQKKSILAFLFFFL